METSKTTSAQAEPMASRRDLFLGIGSLAGLGALAAESDAQSPPPSTQRVPETMLLRRATYGVTEESLAEMTDLGFTPWLTRQMTMTNNEDSVCENAVRTHYPRAAMAFSQLRVLEDDWETSNQLLGATMYRAIHSKRQLFQRLCEFWFDHFNIYMYKVGAWQTVDYYNTVIRKHALGKFPEMLWASAHHPAMMLYLDNATSEGGNPNQNYAREIMELHTLSSTGGYTQYDVAELSRCLTGWGVEWDPQQPNYGQFEYHDWAHDDATKHVITETIWAGGGKTDGERIIQYLAKHPNTAAFIAKKMVRWFMGVGNFYTLENLVAQKYLATNGDIKEMLKLILKRNTLLLASPKLKRPFHLYVSMIRAMGGTVTDIGGIRWGYLGQGGHEPFTWANPNGYPDETEYWAGLMLPRWNFALNMMSGGLREITFDWRAVIGSANTAQKVVDRLNNVFFAGEQTQAEKDRMKSFLTYGVLNDNRLRGAIALSMCSPSFQWF